MAPYMNVLKTMETISRKIVKGKEVDTSIKYKVWTTFYRRVVLYPTRMTVNEAVTVCMESLRDRRGNKQTASTRIKKLVNIYWHSLYDPELSFEVRESLEGVGLFAKRNIKFIELKKCLFGQLWCLHPVVYDSLVAEGAQNLYSDVQNVFSGDREPFCGVIYGAISLLNHSCRSKIGFSKPGTQTFCYSKNGRISLKNTSFLKFGPEVQEGQEILLNYGHQGCAFVCKCEKCILKARV